MPLCFDVQAMCNPPRHHQHISRMSDYSCAEMLHHVTPVKRPCILSFKSYAPVLQTLRKQTLGLRECDWTLSHIWCLIIRDIELSTTVRYWFLDVQAQTENLKGVGFQDLACFRNDVGEFFHMELSEKAALLFSEPFFGQTTHAFNETPPERMGPRGHRANDPVMAATCGRALLPQWAS